MNLPTPKIKPYLTIIQSRNPVQKMHNHLGHAKNALNGKTRPSSHYFFRGERIPFEMRWQMTAAERKEIIRREPFSEDMQLWEWKDNEWKLMYDVKAGDYAPWK